MPLHEEYVPLWKEAGYPHEYPNRMGSAAVIPPPPKEFLRVYHLSSTEHAVSNIAFSRLKAARINELNDPFELLAPNLKCQRVRELVAEFKNKRNEKIALLCFSENWTNAMLWSHYGACHKGICFGFDVPRTLLQKVCYIEERPEPEFSIDTGTLTLEMEAMMLATKFEHWEYEQERRRILTINECSQVGNLRFVNFDKTLQLREVILGFKCDLPLEDARNLVSRLFGSESGVTTFRARLAHKSFSVAPEKGTVP